MTLALVTGANGFLGSAVVRALLADGMAVRALRPARQRPAQPRGSRRGDRDRRPHGAATRCAEPRRGCAAVFHVAADYRLWVADSAPMYRANVEGSVNVLEAAAAGGAARMVYTSSVAVLGINRDRTPADEDTPVTVDRHGRATTSARSSWPSKPCGGARASSASPS